MRISDWSSDVCSSDLPGGQSILLDRQPGADAAGMAGLQDQTNHHWGNVLKATLVSTLLGVGTELATANDSALIQALRYGTQDTVNQTGRKLGRATCRERVGQYG